MSELVMKRRFAQDAAKVFAFVTRKEFLLKWWGPEGVQESAGQLDLSRLGSWSSTMTGGEGERFHVSGMVVLYEPDSAVEFTWGWHDETGQRGHESKVRFYVVPAENGGCEFIMTHSGLTEEDAAHDHETGWTSSFVCLEEELAILP